MLLWDKIETQSNVFSSTEQKLISYIKKNPQIIFKTITEVIEESGVGYGTIIRFCKKIGCSGFQDFKIRLATENNHAFRYHLWFLPIVSGFVAIVWGDITLSGKGSPFDYLLKSGIH